jgi:hypothetical protein
MSIQSKEISSIELKQDVDMKVELKQEVNVNEHSTPKALNSPIEVSHLDSSEPSQLKNKRLINMNMTPIYNGLSPQMGKMTNSRLNLSSPNANNKISINMTPCQNDYFSGFHKDDFQLKNSSDKKNPRLIEFSYPAELLSKSNSSKKANLAKLIKTPEMDQDSGLKRRLFEKDDSSDDFDEAYDNYNVIDYHDEPSIVHNLITPPPKTARRVMNVLTDQKLSGVKYMQDNSVYKGQKYKHAPYSMLIPFCKKCNLPPILHIGRLPLDNGGNPPNMYPMPMPHAPPMVQKQPIEHSYSHNNHTSGGTKSKSKTRQKKKLNVDENGKRIIKRRKRKSYEQLQQLIKEFKANPDWSKDHMVDVARKTGLSEAQVYKWGWDQKRKMLDPNHDIHDELKMYKHSNHDDESQDDESSLRKFKLPVSNSKRRKLSDGSLSCRENKANNGVKTRKHHIKEHNSNNKENVNPKNFKNKPETRGIKRKLI